MAKIKSVKSNTEVYAEIIADIASRAAAEIEGAELLGKNPDKSRIIKDNDVHAYVKSDNTVDIDIYLNILYGYNIPDTVCKVQIAIKKAIEKETCYKVGEVNVSVVSIIVEETDDTPVIVHDFDDEETDDVAKSEEENA
ncbi:MAG: Asp23/Gls24 family envelope stress response protein [Clostridiales bacterium]|nr:Asp23/Gls24 family envelope stress response protein [Clostridiales bacterium]MDD7167136.1 Asp23/Gls24 family envelope stress response protein [Clostridiales bacterium]MDY5529401.1 Asp23/Gls24 family envelope stress response protein [Eubacteriales bacterium]MDY5689493.1 Asp23/Gls24 family envelope stress response protein [Eubacteriales bacterium]MEE0400159.1 Asp23/Gls24 family envelope stress response protein [Christensenellales bacterium]